MKLALNAMATRFELVLHGENASSLRAAGEEAFAEVERLENQLSLYRPGSEIAQVNARAAREAVRVSPEVFSLLQHAAKLSAETGGAFDITIGPLVRCWGFMGAIGKMPSPEEVAEAQAKVGMQHVILDTSNRTVRFARAAMKQRARHARLAQHLRTALHGVAFTNRAEIKHHAVARESHRAVGRI